MGFLFNNSAKTNSRPATEVEALQIRREEPKTDASRIHSDLMARRPRLLDEKLKLHGLIIDEFNLNLLEKLSPEELHQQVKAYVGNYIRAEHISLNQKELDTFTDEVIAEMTGFGPIEPLLKDPTVSDILINTHTLCFIERFGKLERTNVRFKDEAHLLRIVNKIVSGIGRRVDEASPMVDARLPDGSRVNVHSADRGRRADGVDPQIFRASVQCRASGRRRRASSGYGRCFEGGGAGPDFACDLGRHGHWKNDTAQRSFRLHPRG